MASLTVSRLISGILYSNRRLTHLSVPKQGKVLCDVVLGMRCEGNRSLSDKVTIHGKDNVEVLPARLVSLSFLA